METEYNLIISKQIEMDIKQIRFYKEKFGSYEGTISKLMKKFDTAAVESLATSPMAGTDLSSRLGFATNFRYKVVEKKYLIFYTIDGKNVNVVRILPVKSNWQRVLFK